jgi:hypothetical protein
MRGLQTCKERKEDGEPDYMKILREMSIAQLLLLLEQRPCVIKAASELLVKLIKPSN